MKYPVFTSPCLRRVAFSLLAAGAFAAQALCANAAGAKPSAIGVDGLSINPTGAFTLDGVDIHLMHFTPEWAGTPQGRVAVEKGYPQVQGNTWQTRAALSPRSANASLQISEQLQGLSPNALRAQYEVRSAEGVPTKEIALQLSLPLDLVAGRPVIINGKPRTMPPVFTARGIFADSVAKEQTLVVPSLSGSIEITGKFNLMIQDQRQWQPDGGYTLRLRFAEGEGNLREADFSVTLRQIPWQSKPVSIRAQVNRAFADEIANDGKGGWTDQGPVNDLSSISAGQITAAGVTFDIIDENTNNGNAAIVFGRKASDGLPRTATLAVDGAPVWRNVYLLHAGAWMPKAGTKIGTLRAVYTDGTQSESEIIAGRDVGNWWTPPTLPNGTVGWTGENPSSPLVGLYVSRFPLEQKPLKELVLDSAGSSLWMVTGVSGSADDIIHFEPQVPFEAVASADWAPYRYSIEVEPGSVFDFSFLTDGPAGKYGALKVSPEGYFEFADKPGERVRFWGANLCFSANYLEPEEARMLARRFAASGYNTVRIHHYDRDISAKGQPSYIPDPEQLAKLDALFAAMKDEGIYINIDLYTSRRFTAEEMAEMGIDPNGEIPQQFKSLVPISEVAFENWKRYAENLLTHRNPYTGLTWAEDPALIGICPVNEDPLEVWIGRAPVARKMYEEAFIPWWADADNKAKVNNDRAAGFSMFLHEKQIDADARMHAFLRSLGSKALMTGMNFHGKQAQTVVREHYDYVDNHQYWDHPDFPEQKWTVPFRFAQGSGVRSAALAPRDLMPARVWGKPYVITEFNFVRPNRYRAEGGVFMPAYASLQDWDGLYNFDYASHRATILNGGTAGTFSIANDPIGMLADRVSALVFLRGDVEPARNAIGYAVRTPDAFTEQERHFPPVYSRLGLVSRIGSGTAPVSEAAERYDLDAVIVGAGAPAALLKDGSGEAQVFRANSALLDDLLAAGVLPEGSVSEGGTRFVSDTGQIELLGNEGAMKVVTDRSELFVLPAAQAFDGDRVSVKNGSSFGTVSVVAVDGEPIADSSRLLVMHLTDALATGMKFANQDRRLVLARGHLPHLINAGEVEISLRLDPAKGWRAWAVDTTGKRQREVELVQQGDAFILNAKTVDGADVQLAYEVVAE